MTTASVVAMHMSDGIVSAPTSLLFGVIAAAGLAVAARRANTELDERTVPLAGLVAAFIFAVQMVNFPILPGVSGHLLGGALAAILVGPYTGALCIAIVLVVQSLLFADGGVSALGTNITNMALIGVTAAYLTAVTLAGLIRRRGPLGVRQLGLVGFASAVVATVAAAMGFLVEYAIGGAAQAPLGSVGASLRGPHLLIGLGEGLITAVTLMAVGTARPDLVYLLRSRRVAVGASA